MRTVALVGMNGSIDWYSYPHFDSPSIFGAILDDKNGGCFRISADSDGVLHKQFYWTDPRMIGTTNAILKNPRDGGLLCDNFVYCYPPQPRIDGLSGEEGTFNMCSFWLVEALTRAGLVFPEKLDQARLLFERVLGYANHLGFTRNKPGRKARRWAISRKALHILR
jgi:GH15 family glucan-1,4-alpha-glucosidase